MRDETGGIAIEEFFGLKQKMYSFLVDDSSELAKAKGVNKNVAATINHSDSNNIQTHNNLVHKRTLSHTVPYRT